MHPLNLLRRPEYAWNPARIWRRLRRRPLVVCGEVQLAWGLPIRVPADDRIGGDIVNLGVYDLVVAETLLRLAAPGEFAIDVGAHCGQNASILALAVGSDGRVVAFEPNPESQRDLVKNVALWGAYEIAPITIEAAALSRSNGSAPMYPAMDLGGFSLEQSASPSVSLGRQPAGGVGASFAIATVRLDTYLAPGERVGVMKIDVEGHEAAVLEGAGRLLAENAVRDVVFEDYEPQPSRAVGILRDAGFSVFAIGKHWFGPRLIDLADYEGDYERHAPNFVASREPHRLRARMRGIGWHCLRRRARLRRSP